MTTTLKGLSTDLDTLYEASKNDRTILIGSDVRVLINEIRRLRFMSEDGGLSGSEIRVALSNLGIDTTCGSCMSVFYTGSADHPHTCNSGNNKGTTIKGPPSGHKVSMLILVANKELAHGRSVEFTSNEISEKNLRENGLSDGVTVRNLDTEHHVVNKVVSIDPHNPEDSLEWNAFQSKRS